MGRKGGSPGTVTAVGQINLDRLFRTLSKIYSERYDTEITVYRATNRKTGAVVWELQEEEQHEAG